MLCVTPGCSRYWRQDAEKTGQMRKKTQYVICYHDDGDGYIFSRLIIIKRTRGWEKHKICTLMGSICFLYAVFSLLNR